jgi:hypothetical protein
MIEAAAPPDAAPLAERARVLVPGLCAWSLTVAHPAAQAGAPVAARITAFFALLALAAAPLFVRERPALSRLLGIFVFVAFSAVSWALLADELAVDRLDRLRAGLGALGWLLYAFGWGSFRGRGVPEDDPHVVPGAPLTPRARLSRIALAVAVLAVAATLLLVAFAFRVDRREQAVFGHTMATALGLLVLAVGARIALAQGTRLELAPPSARLSALAVPGAALAVLFGIGMIWAALR